jgi:imidazole glycerol-phosphate synthase subunit HisH
MIGVIDYGLGNTKSFINIYKRLNIPCCLVSSERDFQFLDKVILPGVGSFDYALSLLETSGMIDCLNEFVINENNFVLGVCIGMQIMADSSEEGTKNGLGWIPGNVKKLTMATSSSYPLPHMGWNSVHQLHNTRLFDQVGQGKEFYFLHSYYFDVTSEADIIAKSSYPDQFASIVNKNNIYGIQFHPEKSHHNGVQILKNFAEL